jgi:hypothetical protein
LIFYSIAGKESRGWKKDNGRRSKKLNVWCYTSAGRKIQIGMKTFQEDSLLLFYSSIPMDPSKLSI